ncbi:MAG: tetratricopeptide repeat protein [Polyangia bacterium]
MPTATPHRLPNLEQEQPPTGPSTSLATLQALAESVRQAAHGQAPRGAERLRLLRRLHKSGPAVLPTLLRALTGDSEPAAAWAQGLLGDKALTALRPQILRRLDALLADRRPSDRVKSRVLSLQADLAAPLSTDIVLQDPEALLRESVRELLRGLQSDGEVSEAVELILTQVPRAELLGFVDEVIRHGGPAAQPLLSALVLDPRTPRELAPTLLAFTRPAVLSDHPVLSGAMPPEAGRPPRRGSADLVGSQLERALTLLQEGRVSEAHRRLVGLARAHGDRPEVQSALGLCCLRLDRPDEALVPLGHAAALEPGVAVHHFNLATAEGLAEQPGSCYRSLVRYLSGTDVAPGAERRQAAAREQLASYERSAAARYPGLPLDEVLQAEDGFEVAYRALRDGRPDDAIAGFRAVLARVPRHVPSWGNLGLAYQAAGRRREATRCWRRALQLDPGYALARDSLAGGADAKTGRRLP